MLGGGGCVLGVVSGWVSELWTSDIVYMSSYNFNALFTSSAKVIKGCILKKNVSKLFIVSFTAAGMLSQSSTTFRSNSSRIIATFSLNCGMDNRSWTILLKSQGFCIRHSWFHL